MQAVTPERRNETVGLTGSLADRACELRFESLPADVVVRARQCILDWVGVALAGSREPLTGFVLDELQAQGGCPQAAVVGSGVRLPTLSAALVNGAASHALDFDDVNLALHGHPTVAVLPGVLALAESRRASGQALIAAFVAGYETACAIGERLGTSHYARGFHATATIGSFGAAAACAHLLGLDGRRAAFALGIAGTQAAGLKSMFGTMCKPLHAGRAGYNGLFAASLAARGFDSRPDVLETDQGFAATQCDPSGLLAPAHAPAGGFHLRGNLFKYHASCYLTHSTIECGRALRRTHGIEPERVERVTIQVDEGCDRICNIPEPRTGLEAKFSLRQTAAFALAGVDTAALGTYDERQLAEPAVARLRDKVSVRFTHGSPHTLATMEVELDDGRRFAARHDAGTPAPSVSEQGDRLDSKFLALAIPVLGPARAQSLLATVHRLDQLPCVSELTGLFAPPSH